MVRFCKRNFGLTFVLVGFLLGLPFFHYHPDNIHTHQSELSPHHHEGHFHSHELNGFVQLIDHNSANPLQSEEHHPHSDTDSGTNYFEVNLQKSDIKPVKTRKTFKSGNTQKPFLVSGPTFFQIISTDNSAFEIPDSTFISIERSPPLLFV